MASIGEQNSTDSNLSEPSESETENMTLKDLKMAAMARAAANKDRKEGMTAPGNEKCYQQEGMADQDSGKEKLLLFDDEVDQLCLSSILIVFIHISITPVNDVIIIIGLLHIIIFGVVVVMMMLIISSSVAQ